MFVCLFDVGFIVCWFDDVGLMMFVCLMMLVLLFVGLRMLVLLFVVLVVCCWFGCLLLV